MSGIDHETFKIVALVLIFAVGFAGGLFALSGRNDGSADYAFSIGSVFAGGIFLGAGLVHLLPDGIRTLNFYFVGSEFPIGYLIAAVGFLGVLFIEEILFGDVHAGNAPAGQQAAVHGSAAGLSAYALVVILSVHSVLAGAALGAEDTATGSLVIFLAIIAHKGAAGFALALDFRRADFARAKSMRLLVIFATMTPLGVVVGTGLNRFLEHRSGELFEGLFDTLAAGTFLYVAVVEIIAKEFADRQGVVTKFVLLCLGLMVMALIALWV